MSSEQDQNPEVVVEISGLDEAAAEELKTVFNGEQEDVLFSHAFGGQDLVTILTTVTSLGGKLSAFWDKHKLASAPKTELVIEGKRLSLKNFSREDIEQLAENPAFLKLVKTARAK